MGSRPVRVELAPWPAGPPPPYRAGVPVYVVPRTRAWLSEEELAAATDCLPAVIKALGGEVRWIRSYVVAEADGTFSAYCVYEATGPQALLRHAEAMMLPTDVIKPVVTTIVAALDPEPLAAP